MNPATRAWLNLTARAREVALLNSISSALHWDQQTQLPVQGTAHRSEQLAWLASRTHSLWTAPEVHQWIGEVAAAPSSVRGESEPLVSRSVAVWQRHYDRATRLPSRLVEELARASARAHTAWEQARGTSDYPLFAPHLEKLLALAREQAACWNTELHPYDAHLEGYEPGLRASSLESLFAHLADALLPLAERAEQAPPAPPLAQFGPFPASSQDVINRKIASACGFDWKRGRLDTSAHPFCSSLGPQDVRLTTRHNESDFLSSLFAVLHEVGHGLYEQNLSTAHYGLPAGEALYLGIHESQSRIWENHVGRASEFFHRWFPDICQIFPSLRPLGPHGLWKAANRVSRSFIRVEADEVTYDLHIILRFRLEFALLEGTLEAQDLPAAWNEEFEKLFGLAVPDDARGCLQDVHWSGGAFGYFPTYTLGNLRAAQFMEAASKQISGLSESLALGEYAPLLGWLRDQIHVRGSLLAPEELVEKVTGQTTSARPFLEYLKNKVSQR